ncbi:hypothetical protein [Paraferrimonas sp. SM1919]|uniref:hypothetical protein n=1 Tax=Paraferrimonas sp. SM1919 TaxID=2662263 RepID=UPI0013D16E0D|nr:hypothetical protein [Paraferrimonas sp. SM1919]
MLKNTTLTIGTVLGLVCTTCFTPVHADEKLQGQWLTENQNNIVTISQSADGIWRGTITQAEDESQQQVLLVNDIKPNNNGYTAKINAIKAGKWLEANLKLNGQQLQITARHGFFSKTMTWSKK